MRCALPIRDERGRTDAERQRSWLEQKLIGPETTQGHGIGRKIKIKLRAN